MDPQEQPLSRVGLGPWGSFSGPATNFEKSIDSLPLAPYNFR